jgi:hypothetical protein
MSRKEKSAWLGDTAEADLDDQQQNERSLPAADGGVNEAPKPPDEPNGLRRACAQQFALARSRALTRSRRVSLTGCITFVVTRWAGERYFSHLHDVQGHLSQITDRVRIYAKGRGDGL